MANDNSTEGEGESLVLLNKEREDLSRGRDEQIVPEDADKTTMTDAAVAVIPPSRNSKVGDSADNPFDTAANDPSRRRHQRRGTWRQRLLRGAVYADKFSEELHSQLNIASEALLDLLFEHLSRGMKGSKSNTDDTGSSGGISLPVAAVGWLSRQLFPSAIGVPISDDTSSPVVVDCRAFLSPTVRDRLSLLRFLLPRVTHIRLTSEEWPPPPTSRRKRSRRRKYLERLREEQLYTGDEDVEDHQPLVEEHHDAPSLPRRFSGFLSFYDALVHRPVVDMRVFSNCQVLLLDQVPVEWIINLYAVRNSLQVLRVERSCIFDLRAVFLPQSRGSQDASATATRDCDDDVDYSSSDPLAPPATTSVGNNNDNFYYPQLTHVKLSHCSITDASGLKGSKRREQTTKSVVPALAPLVNLQSLCLAHNQLASESAALVGLSNMPYLTKLDLSFNHFVSLRRIHYHLGNIQTLLLSHNQLKSAQGIDHLYALETLWLDHNLFEDMAQLSALARLPELKSLRLKGNPVEIRRTGTFRVELWDLFRETRQSSLPPGATFRDLQQILPILDQHKVSMAEMRELKERTFLPSMQRVPVDRNHSNSNLSPGDETNTIDVSVEAGICERRVPRSTVVPMRPTGSIQRSKRRQALVDRPPTRHVKITSLKPRVLQNDGTEQVAAVEKLQPDGLTPKVDFSLSDVIRSLCDPSVLEEPKLADENPSVANVQLEAVEDGQIKAPNGAPVGVILDVPAEECTNSIGIASKLDGLTGSHDELPASNGEAAPMRDGPTSGEETSDSAEDQKVPGSFSEPDSPEREVSDITENSNEKQNAGAELEKLKLSPIGRFDPKGLTKSLETTATTADTGARLEEDATSKVTDIVGPPDIAIFVTPKPRRTTSDLSETPSSVSPVRLPMSFPDIVPNDDHTSVQSSTGTPSTRRKYQVAEENSTYDGPSVYKDIKIHEDLELYFRLFVFPIGQSEDDVVSRSTTADDGDDSEWRDVLKRYPRIQLWPVDVRNRDLAHVDQPERFRRIWREKIVACGLTALRRLTPNRGARYGFHGELLWSDSSASNLRPETVAECREIVLCCSNSCLYFILDYDAVTAKASHQQRSFPLPIPKESRFKDAIWPHALARHPFSTLRAITIGFMFQRLTLRFGKSSAASLDDYIYILLTSSKVQTISLLKEFQDLSNEARASFVISEGALSIQNDDRHVLDSIGMTVAPDVLGVTLHYQILEQHWRRGERGTVRRVVVLTDTRIFLLDEDYVGDGAKSYEAGTRLLGETVHRLVDSAAVSQIARVQAADADPNAVTIVLNPQRSFQRSRNWRLKCRDRHGAERLVEDVRRAVTPPSPYPGRR